MLVSCSRKEECAHPKGQVTAWESQAVFGGGRLQMTPGVHTAGLLDGRCLGEDSRVELSLRQILNQKEVR